ncbi:MAG: GtrA family protein [Devosia sp.]|nr:GtrA family protein [Devosia sp.]
MDDLLVDTPRSSAAAELVSFLIVGGLAAICFVGLSTLMIGLRSGIQDWVMSVLCYAAMIVPVYVAHRRFSFRSSLPHGVALPRYVAVQLSAVALAAVFSFVCYGIFGMPALAAALVVTALTSGVNFLVLRLWAFATTR